MLTFVCSVSLLFILSYNLLICKYNVFGWALQVKRWTKSTSLGNSAFHSPICHLNVKNAQSLTWLNRSDHCFSTVNVVILQPEAAGNLGTVELTVAETGRKRKRSTSVWGKKGKTGAVHETQGAESCRFDRNTGKRKFEVKFWLGEKIICIFLAACCYFPSAPWRWPLFG